MGVNLVGREQSSFSGDGIVTTDYGNNAIVKGDGFTFEKLFTILSGATLYVLVDYTTYTPGLNKSGNIFILPPVFRTTAGPAIVTVYRGTDYAGGTEFSAINPNTTAAKSTSGTTFTAGATGTTKGDVVLEYLVGGDSLGVNRAAGDATGLAFFVRNNTNKTLVEIDNQSGVDIQFTYSQLLFEV